LGEIEIRPGSTRGSAETSVIAREYGDEKRLTAYIVSRHGLNVDVSELRKLSQGEAA